VVSGVLSEKFRYDNPVQDSSRQVAKPQRTAKLKAHVFFAALAYFAPWRETGSSVHGLIDKRDKGPPFSSRPPV
jgi:hypothetical protein